MTQTQTIVILGAGWAGLPLAHKLLKHTLPKTSLKVVLVTPNSRFFWNVAATRGLIPGEIPDDDLFLPIAPGFSRYPAEAFELVLGRANRVDETANTVSITTNDGVTRDIQYAHLVIATGSSLASGLPLKPLGSDEQTLDAWHDLQQRIASATSIVIAGAGPTGVEVAGELAAKYGSSKKITLISSGSKPLLTTTVPTTKTTTTPLHPALLTTVSQDLQTLNITLLPNTRVTTALPPTTSSQQFTLTLSTNETLTADLYLPLHGIIPNTSFLPSHLLDPHGNVLQDPHLRAAGTTNIWALGDVGNTEAKQLTLTDAQIVHVAKALDTVLTAAVDADGKEGGVELPVYVPEKKTMVFLALGRRFATGQIGGWRLWGWLVAWVKGRRLFVDTARGYVGGERLRHGAM